MFNTNAILRLLAIENQLQQCTRGCNYTTTGSLTFARRTGVLIKTINHMSSHFVVLAYEPCRNENDAHATRYYFDNVDRVNDYLYELQCEHIDVDGLYPYEILVYEEAYELPTLAR